MNRKLIRALSCILVISAIISFTSGFAASAYEPGFNNVNAYSQKVKASNEELAEKIVDKANADIEAKVAATKSLCDKMYSLDAEKHDALITNHINKMVEKTNAIAEKAINDCAKLGVTAVCEYTVVIIAGREVWVDPIKTIGA